MVHMSWSDQPGPRFSMIWPNFSQFCEFSRFFRDITETSIIVPGSYGLIYIPESMTDLFATYVHRPTLLGRDTARLYHILIIFLILSGFLWIPRPQAWWYQVHMAWSKLLGHCETFLPRMGTGQFCWAKTPQYFTRIWSFMWYFLYSYGYQGYKHGSARSI